MKYYSEKLNKVFDTVEDLESAEKEHAEKETQALKLREERKVRAKEVEDAYIAYKKLLNQFIKDYGSYHQTIKDKDSWSILDVMFGGWPF